MRPAPAAGGVGGRQPDRQLSLYRLLDPAVLADPYPLYARLREESAVHWDPFLHAWVVTRYEDVLRVLTEFSAARLPDPAQLSGLGMEGLASVAEVMVRQMLFLDAPAHTRVRRLAAKAFTPKRVEALRGHIAEIVDRLMEGPRRRGSMDLIGDLARPLPAIVTAEMLGLPSEDWLQLTAWSRSFAEVLGNIQQNPSPRSPVVRSVMEMTEYMGRAVRDQTETPRDGLLSDLIHAQVDGDRFSADEVIANVIITMVGGQETTTNLIGNGLLSLFRNPDQWDRLRAEPSLVPPAVEELLRYESPSQYTARVAPEDTELGGRAIRKGQGVIVVMGAANRDPDQFPDPDRLDLGRDPNRHLAFGWAAHVCFGASLARIEGQEAFAALTATYGDMRLRPEPVHWRSVLSLRGLDALPVEL